MADNGRRLREGIMDYIQQRKNGERKSQVGDGADLLSLFLKRQDVFTDEWIVDELLSFFGAATLTSSYAMQTFLVHCAQSPSSVQKMRDEFKNVVQSGNESKSELLSKAISAETTQDMDYLGRVMMEVLRISPPTTESTFFHLK